jgi:hypothetical protein
MIDTIDHLPPENIILANINSRNQVPFFSSLVQGGFASPAENYIERRLDRYALAALKSIFAFNYTYQKVGIILSNLVPVDGLICGWAGRANDETVGHNG